MIEWMKEFLDVAIQWVSNNAGWILIVSLVMLVVSVLAIRLVIIKLPSDYFLDQKPCSERKLHPTLSVLLLVLRNIIGFIFVLVGLILSLPGVVGQGILTLLLGLSIMDFPGKRKLELKIISRRIVFHTINSLRAKASKPPLLLPEEIPN
ncbi:MAG: hypothetical protein HY707_10825 [Ignavibacteriae bacterium]|nr:hypothetical protein [Ignavibacteriota bacterium]